MGKLNTSSQQHRSIPPQTPPPRSHLIQRHPSKDASHYLPARAPRTPSPPSSPPEIQPRTPLISGGSTLPWDRSYRVQNIPSSPLTPRYPFLAPHSRSTSNVQSSPLLPQHAASSFASEASIVPQEPELTSATTVGTPHHAPSTPYSRQHYIQQEENWQTLYPSEIAAFDTATLRNKLSQANALLTKLSSSLAEARTQAAHFTFQHRLLTIETEEAMQRHQVENEMAKREVEILRKDGAGGGSAHQRYELEEMIDLYKKRLRRVKLLLRDTREELSEVRQENERLKKRIRENRQNRIRDMEAELGIGPGVEEYGNDDAVVQHEYYGNENTSPPQHKAAAQKCQPTPRRSSINHVLSSPGHNQQNHQPQTSVSTAPNQKEEDALTTLGLLASQVLSQEGLSEPQTPRTDVTRVTPGSTTPIRGIISTVPSTPLSQTRNRPGPEPQTPTPKTPKRRGGSKQSSGSVRREGNTMASGSKARSAGAQYGTPAYTSPAVGSSSTIKANNTQALVPDFSNMVDTRGKKRRLSSDSTLSATHAEDEADSLNESELEEVVRAGSPTPAITRKGRVLSTNGTTVGSSGYKGQRVDDRMARFNKRTRGM